MLQSPLPSPALYTTEICEAAAREYGVSGAVHADDHIFRYIYDLRYFPSKADAVHHYFANGRESAVRLREIVADFVPSPQVSVLEFASGYGCVTRHLRKELPSADVTACDIHPAAIEFVREMFGTPAVISEHTPERLALDQTFDVTFALSFFSHMPEATWCRWLARLASFTRPGGVVIFTTHGHALARAETRASLDENGFWFHPSSDQPDLSPDEYGTSITSVDFVYRQIRSIPNLRLVKFHESAWWKTQDLYVAQVA